MSYRIGVDGGGTKTDCILLDAGGAVASHHAAPGCNPSLVGPDRARAVLMEALQALLAAAPRPPDVCGAPVEKAATHPAEVRIAGSASPTVDHLLLCMAGSQSFWRETAAGISGCGRVETMPDSSPVLELATDGAPGLVVHAGTGSFIAARAPDGSLHYAGGLGWRFGDAASSHDIGRRAIAEALLELQGWAPRTALGDRLCEHTGLADYVANSNRFYHEKDADAAIAAFAPRVVSLAGLGCVPAQKVVAESLTSLATIVGSVCSRLFPEATAQAPVRCGVSGALLNSPPCWHTLCALAAAHAWPVRLHPVTDRPIEGVRRLLQKMA